MPCNYLIFPDNLEKDNIIHKTIKISTQKENTLKTIYKQIYLFPIFAANSKIIIK